MAIPVSAVSTISSSLPELEELDVTIATLDEGRVPALNQKRGWWMPAGSKQLRCLRLAVRPVRPELWPQQELQDDPSSCAGFMEEE